MLTRPASTTLNALMGLLIAMAIVAGVFAVLHLNPWGDQPSVQAPEAIDPALIGYQQMAEIRVGMQQVRALAVGADDRIYVGGDKAIHVFSADGAKLAEIALGGEPQCVAVAGQDHAFPGRIYVGMEDHVEVLQRDGKPLASWKPLKHAALTSIAAAGRDVFAADAYNMRVWRYDPAGTLKGSIDGRGNDPNSPGFVVTSASRRYFDLAAGRDGLLYVVNPLRLRIEVYWPSGEMKSHWGRRSTGVEGFYGCCNPAHFAILPDGRFVTAEKGIARVKIYTPDGQFECVVAAPEQMPAVAADLVADSQGRILVLDPSARSVRIFEPIQEEDSGADQ